MIFSSQMPLIIVLLAIIFPQTTFPSFLLQSGSPAITQNFISPESGCRWSGVAGQVFGLDGTPLNGRIIEVRGELHGQAISLATTSGSSLQMGHGGFDIQISDTPVSSQADLYILIVDHVGEPLTKRIYFETVGQCDQNLTIINLVEFLVTSETYLPLVIK